VIFDVDGTLYNQSALRKRMLKKLLTYYALRPWRSAELKVLHAFRAEREKHAGHSGGGIDQLQYQWTAEKSGAPVGAVERVVTHWMLEQPLKVLADYRFAGLQGFFGALRESGVSRAVYSDYPFKEKMQALGLDYELGVDSTMAHVDALKPDPKGIEVLMQELGIKPEFCVFIGDRDERDGECARRAGVQSIIVDTSDPNFFDRLTTELREGRE